MFKSKLLASVIALSAVASFTLPAHAGAVRNMSSFTGNTLAANDDGSTGFVNFGFAVNFYGLNTNGAFVNNNGNLTFSGPLSTYTPFGIRTSALAMIAPFFADVDTRGAGSGLTQYGATTLAGKNVFGVNCGRRLCKRKLSRISRLSDLANAGQSPPG